MPKRQWFEVTKYLCPDDSWSTDKNEARVFYNKQDERIKQAYHNKWERIEQIKPKNS